MLKTELNLKRRLIAVILYFLVLELTSGFVTGIWVPAEGGRSLWFYSAIGLYFFTHLTSPYFIAPRDALANSATSALLLATTSLTATGVLQYGLERFRWFSFFVVTLAALSALVAMALYGSDPVQRPIRSAVSRIAFGLSNRLGTGQVAFSPLVLISVVGFYQGELIRQSWLLFVWAILVFVQPVELALTIIDDVAKTRRRPSDVRFVGSIQRIDDPNIVRVKLEKADTWKRDHVHIVHLPDSRQAEVLPLFVQLQDAELIGSGLCCSAPPTPLDKSNVGHVYYSAYASTNASALVQRLCGDGSPAELIGFVIENSEISKIWFEVSSDIDLEEGWLVFVRQRDQRVYYQILDARTKEESFAQNPRGTQVVIAEQLGTLDDARGFVKYGWLPSMNTPVFSPRGDVEVPAECPDNPLVFSLGHVPNSNIPVRVRFSDVLEYHTAILGVTGTGKTELAFDIIRHAVKEGTKVFCVDFTSEYKHRLADLKPQILGLGVGKVAELDKALFDVEAGEFSAGKEKQALQKLMNGVATDVTKKVEDFLSSAELNLGIFEIEEIANTKATLRATELYLSSVFRWARTHRKQRRILLVLEEAHTIVPEFNLFGFDKVETSAVIGRMAQIALQGRKYGVGLLLVSQRTALVSKTLLSQCNTVLCFSLHDETGLNYLGNVFSSEHVRAIPNLRPLHAIAFGKAVLSDRPIIFEIPWDQKKKNASEELDHLYEHKEDELPF
jgi:hypothetical protein